MGGTPPLGYDVRDRKLAVNETEAELVRLIFGALLAGRIGHEAGAGTPARRPYDEVMDNAGRQAPSRASRSTRVRSTRSSTIGFTSAKRCTRGQAYPGEHAAIIDRVTWDKVHSILAENAVVRANATRAQTPALLRGLIFAPGGHAMTPSHTRKNGRLYRYYVSTVAIRQGYSECPVRSVPAAEVEEAVVAQVQHLLRTPEIIARTWAAARGDVDIPERDVVKTVTDFAPLWDELFPAEQARIVRLLGRADRPRTRWHAGPATRRGAADAGRGTPAEGCRMKAKRKVVDLSWELDNDAIVVTIPIQWKRRGGRKLIIAPDEGDAWAPAKPRPDETLIRALARAHRWKRMIEDGTYRSAGEIADAEKVTRSFVNRLLRLTLLAPDTVEAILDGRHPKVLQLEELTKALPSVWDEQRHHLLATLRFGPNSP